MLSSRLEEADIAGASEDPADAGLPEEDGDEPDPDEVVTVVVELEQGLTHGGFFGLFAQSGSDHDQYRSRIAALVSEKAGAGASGGLSAQSAIDLPGRDYHNVIDGFTVQVPRNVIDDIRAMDGVAAAFESQEHAAPADMGIQESAPLNESSLQMTGADSVSYTGKGQVIAIVDTGLRTDHEAFKGDLEDDSAVLTEEKVSAIKATLGEGAGGVYVSEKIPFAYDYAMGDNDVADGNGHGTHVAGIAAANAGDVRGTAPDAQLVIMKVGTDQGSILDDALIAALDDCAKFDLAAVNISIGADGGFSGDAQDTMANAVKALEATGVVVNVAAGNSYSSAQGNLSGKDLPYATDPDSGTISSPASAAQATAVASANNVIGMPYFTLQDGTHIEWQGAQDQQTGKAWPTLDALPDGDYLVYFDGDTDPYGDGGYYYRYAATWMYSATTGYGSVPEGAIVLAERGGKSPGGLDATFGYKIRNTSTNTALIVMDNEDADTPMKMAIDDYADWSSNAMPAVSVTKANGELLKGVAKSGGKITLKAGQVTEPPTEYTVNDFSSWGATPDLSLKPDITAPGGNIYSTTNDGAYGYLSGTSMATPQMTGISAQMRQYVSSDDKFASFTDEQRNDVITQLLMSTAKPLSDPSVEDSYYSPRQQGAGIANVPAAVTSDVYLTVDGAADAAHPKAELGESASGEWSFTVTLHNLGNAAATYTPSAATLSDQIEDGLFQQHSVDYADNGIDVTFGGAAYQDGKVTVPANGTASYTVTITCQDAFKQAVAVAANGTFVDGFVFLAADDSNGVDLSVPFMGFYGDWGASPIFDGKLGTQDAHLWGNYLSAEGVGLYGGPLGFNPLDSDSMYDYNNKTSMSARGDWRNHYYPDRLVVSASADNYAPHTVTTNTFLLRGASEFMWGFSKKGEEEGIQAYGRDFLKKSRPNTSTSGDPILSAETIANGYASFSFDDLDEGAYLVEEYAAVAGDKDAEPQTLAYDIYYDKTNPAISDVMNTEGEDAAVTFTVTDKSWLAGVTVQTNPVYVVSTSESIKNYLDTDLSATESVDADGNRVYKVSVPIATLKDAWTSGYDHDESNMPNTLALVAWDWGMNPSEPVTAVLNPVPATGVEVAPSALSLAPGQHGTLEASLAPEDTTDVLVDWSSSDESVATVSADGQVTGVGAGTATITATVHGRSVKATAQVRVSDITAKTGVILSDGVVRVRSDQKAKPATSVEVSAMLADSLTGKEVNWAVSDEDVFSIEVDSDNPNKVTITGGYQVGVGTLSATVTDNGKIRSATVEVRNWPDDYEDFTISADGTLTAYTGAQLSVEIPNDVKAIGEGVLGDTRMTEMRIPASVESIGKEAFLNTPAKTVAFEDTDEHPSKLVEVGERAFANDSQGQIGWSSFRFPDSVTTLGTGVMQGKSCESIYVPEGVTVIPDDAFTGSHDVIYIGDDVTWIGDNAFSSGGPQAMMFGMLYIIGHEDDEDEAGTSFLPGKLAHIGANAFNSTNVFTELTMPAGVTYIGDGAFAGASQSIHNNGGPALKVTLNEGLEHIGDGAFSGTRIDKQLVIPDSVVELGDNAFGSVGTLEKVTIGKNVEAKRLGKVFVYSDSITEFAVADGCANYAVDEQGVVYSKDMSTLVAFPMGKESPDYVIPEGVKVIGECAFDAYDGSFLDFCSNYPHSITFPDSLEVIEAHALNTYLGVVDLGGNVKEVAVDAFRDLYGNDELNPASPAHLVVRGGQDYTVGYTDNVDYYHTSYFGPGVKAIDFSGNGFRTSDIMVVNSDTLDEFKFTTNWWPGWNADPVAIYAKKDSQAYATIKKAILDKVDFAPNAYYDGWCADVEDNESQYNGQRKPILRYYEELTASLDTDADVEPGATVTATVIAAGGVGDVQVRWFACSPQEALYTKSTTGWLDGKTPLWGEAEGDGWTSDLSYTWEVPADGSTIVAEVRDASYYSVQANLADAPAFTTQPASAKVLQGAKAELKAEATVSDGGTVTYQWFRSTTEDLSDAEPVFGATSAAYVVPSDELGTAYYAVVARNTLGNGLYAETRSAIAKVEVVAVDKAALDEAIAQADAMTQGKKADSAFAALKEAIADAKDVAGDDGATQAEVDKAVAALSEAVKAFEASPDVADSPESPDKEPDTPDPDKPADRPADKPVDPASPSDPGSSSAGSDSPSAPVAPGTPAAGDGEGASDGGPVGMNRLYNPYSGEHFYTSAAGERDYLVSIGWLDEGVGWIAPEWSNTPVYRMYNPYAGEHHYCMTAGERDSLVEAGWIDEGIGWYSDDEQRTPLYREYNPYMFSCNHNYTTDRDEHDYLVSLGWIDEGYAWYGA